MKRRQSHRMRKTTSQRARCLVPNPTRPRNRRKGNPRYVPVTACVVLSICLFSSTSVLLVYVSCTYVIHMHINYNVVCVFILLTSYVVCVLFGQIDVAAGAGKKAERQRRGGK